MATTALSKHLDDDSGAIAPSGCTRAIELFWVCLSFVLFLVLGPFSAPVVLIALVRLGMEEKTSREPEAISPW